MKTPSISLCRARAARSLGRWRTPLLSRNIIRLAALVGVALAINHSAQSAVTEAWVQRYSNVVSNSVDAPFRVLSDVAGDIIVTGTSVNGVTGSDILTIKYSGKDGSVVWQRRYNSPANSDDAVSGAALDRSGNVVVVGTSSEGRTWSQGGEYYTAKYASADGAILWEKRRPRVVESWSGFLPACRRGQRRQCRGVAASPPSKWAE